VINGLARNGVTVVHKGNALVHVSGHASAGELLYCYNLIQPRNALPVHGEVRHLIANADLAVATGLPRDRAIVIEDGGVVDLADGRAKVVGRLECGYIFVDGSTVGEIGDAELSDRKILGADGFISVVVVVNLHSSTLVSGPASTVQTGPEQLGQRLTGSRANPIQSPAEAHLNILGANSRGANRVPRTANLIFEEGDLSLSFYLVAGGQGWNGQALCAQSGQVSPNLRTRSGLGLGMSTAEVVRILGQADIANRDRLVYEREVEQQTPGDKLTELRKEHAEMSDKDFHDNYDSYELELYIEARFTSGKLSYLAVSKAESY